MRKNDLVAAVMDRADLSARQADNAVAAILEQITNALSRGEAVNLVGFGSFSVKTRAARTGHHPQTGTLIAMPASKVPGFKAGKHFKAALC